MFEKNVAGQKSKRFLSNLREVGSVGDTNLGPGNDKKTLEIRARDKNAFAASEEICFYDISSKV